MKISEIIKAKKDLYKSLKELDSWAHEDGECRDWALNDYAKAAKDLFVIQADLHGVEYAIGWRDAMDGYVRRTYHVDDCDYAKAELNSYEEQS